MEIITKVFLIPVVLLLPLFWVTHLKAEKTGENVPSLGEVIQKVQKIQMPFTINAGQINNRVKFYAHTFGGSVFVMKDGEIVYSLLKSKNEEVDVFTNNKCLSKNNLLTNSYMIHNTRH